MQQVLDRLPQGISMEAAPGIPDATVLFVKDAAHEWRYFVDCYHIVVASPNSLDGAGFKYDCDLGKRLRVKSSDLAAAGPGDFLRTSQIRKPVSFCFLRLQSHFVERSIYDADEVRQAIPLRGPGLDLPRLTARVRHIITRMYQPDENQEEVESSLFDVCGKVFGALASVVPSFSKRPTLCQRRAKIVRQMIESDPARKWRMSDFLDATDGISAPRLANSFKSVTGSSIFSYLKSVRVARCLEMIRIEKRRLPEVAQELGFYDQPAFGNSFRAVMGVTPGRFARTSLRSIG